MKIKTIALALISGVFLIGCGSSSTEATIEEDAISTDITVERGPVLNATTKDANGQFGKALGNGVYNFTDVKYPVESMGGYIDMNRNGLVDEGDIAVGSLRLKTEAGNVITMATSLGENVESLLLDIGFTKDALENATPSSDIDIAALSDELYKYCYENNISHPSFINFDMMQSLQNKIQERKDYYNSADKTSAQLENDLMDELNVTTLTDTDEILEPMTQMDSNIDDIPASDLTNEQKHTLAYMWNEERLARDMYLSLNELTPSKTLFNIATNAETQHVLAVEDLIQKYDLNIFNTVDYSGGYVAQDLAAYESGQYSIEALYDLHNLLYDKGSASLQDALEVGCLVEVTDINDLDADLALVEGVEDITIVFENLRQGSYSHYWSFDSALKAQGVTDGCCSLGEDYCKTADEYPQANNSEGGGKQHGRQ